MTGRDPEEPDRTPDTDIDAAFAEIVADWEREHGHTEWPTDASPEPVAEPPDEVVDDEPLEDEGHFVPPEPPPLPRPRPQTVGAIALILLGIALLAIPSLVGFAPDVSLALGLLSISGGIVWLIARLRQGPPTDSGWDDGAQL